MLKLWSVLGGVGVVSAAALAGLQAISLSQDRAHAAALGRIELRLQQLDASLRRVEQSVARVAPQLAAVALPQLATADSSQLAPAAAVVSAAPPAHPEVDADQRAPGDEQIRAGDALAGVVRHALQRGSWTAYDRAEFARLAAEADPSEERALRLELTQAINAQRVSVDLPSPF
jgi:hypothetical protein